MSVKRDELVIGQLQFVTTEPHRIMTATSAPGPRYSCIAWHTGTESPNEEEVLLCKILGTVSNPVRISRGADPDCFLQETGGYVSSILRDVKTERWTINLSSFDSDTQVFSTSSPARNVSNLVTRPYLAQFDCKPCLIYLTTNRGGKTEIHSYFIDSGVALDEKLVIGSPIDMVVKWSGRFLIATIETIGELHMFSFNGRSWKVVAKIPKVGSIWPYRFDFAIKEYSARFVMEFDNGERIGTLAVDLADGAIGRISTICEYGKFPSIVAANGQWLISWVGAPALSLDSQGKESISENFEDYIDVLNEIRSNAAAKENEPRKARKRKSEMEELWKVDHVSPWAPLWLGLLDDFGECADTHGPLGGSSDENFDTKLSFQGNKGILMWRSHDNHATENEGCLLKVREIVCSR